MTFLFDPYRADTGTRFMCESIYDFFFFTFKYDIIQNWETIK